MDEKDSDCELRMTLKTWDGVVRSEPVCIKHTGHPVAIPERILLTSTISVGVETYCADDGVTVAKNGCVWNRRFFSNYPMGFAITTSAPKGAPPPLARYVSIVRVLRNGKRVYNWIAAESPDANTIEIPSSAINAPEAFRDPVDLGLYVLESGVDASKLAAADDYKVVRAKWTETLGRAAAAVVDASVPDELRDAYACFGERFRYLRARAANSEAEASAAVSKMQEIDLRATNMTVAYNSSPTAIRVASDQPLDTKAGRSADGVELAEGDKVLQLGPDKSRGQIFEVHLGKPWKAVTPTSIGAQPAKSVWVATVRQGTHAGLRFAFDTDAVESGVRTLSMPVSCATPKDALASLGDSIVDVDGAKAKVSAALGKSASEVDAFILDSKKVMEAALARLPASTQEKIRTGLFWVKYVEELSASAVASTVELRAAAPLLQTTIATKLKDPAARLHAYEAVAASLPNDDTYWSKPNPNPAPIEGEATFRMSFITPRQRYYLLAWNGVPMPVDRRSSVITDIHVENLIPIIDLVGWHWQSTRPFMPSTGIGLGVLGTRETVKNSDGSQGLTSFNFGIQAGFSISSLRVGFGYIFRKDENAEQTIDARNIRVILGVDLVKLFTGKSLTASTSASASNQTDKD